MNRRIVYKEQAKCNFCYNWFQVFSEIKFGLNICEACIYKALNTSCFKFPTPQGHLYQVYLARRNISLNPSTQNPMLEKIDEFMHTQIKQLLQKWQQITKILKSFTCSTTQVEQQIWKKVEFIVKNDSKMFASLNQQTIEQVLQDVLTRQKAQRKILCTPKKEKNINVSIKHLNKSHKNMNRMDSKKSFREVNDKSATKIYLMNDQQNYNQDEPIRRNQTSPFSLGHLKRIGASGNSTRNLNHIQNKQNKEFVARVQLIKNNITSCLEQRGEIPIQQPLSILKERIYQAIQNTNCINKCVELVSYNGLQGIDLKCYLSNLDWQGIEVVKFVKVGFTDQQLEILLEFIKDKSVQTLVLTSNNLTEQSCKNMLKADVKTLRNIYVGKNQIFSHKAKGQIKQLKSKYNFFL